MQHLANSEFHHNSSSICLIIAQILNNYKFILPTPLPSQIPFTFYQPNSLLKPHHTVCIAGLIQISVAAAVTKFPNSSVVVKISNPWVHVSNLLTNCTLQTLKFQIHLSKLYATFIQIDGCSCTHCTPLTLPCPNSSGGDPNSRRLSSPTKRKMCLQLSLSFACHLVKFTASDV